VVKAALDCSQALLDRPRRMAGDLPDNRGPAGKAIASYELAVAARWVKDIQGATLKTIRVLEVYRRAFERRTLSSRALRGPTLSVRSARIPVTCPGLQGAQGKRRSRLVDTGRNSRGE
jgi:hypothetical protein